MEIDHQLLEYVHSTTVSGVDVESGKLKILSIDELLVETVRLTELYIPDLRKVAKNVFGLSDDIFSDVEILVVPSLRFYAEAVRKDGKNVVLMYHGLLYDLSFAIEVDILQNAIREFQMPEVLKERAASSIQQLGEEMFLSYLLFPFPLPHLRAVFTEEMSQREGLMLSAIELFVIFHEIGHIRLGHLEDSTERLQPIPTQFYIDEPNNELKQQELEADLFAIGCFSDEPKTGVFMEAIFLFLAKLSIFESFLATESLDHPCAINRLKNLLNTYSGETRDSLIGALGILKEDRLDGLKFQTFHRQYIRDLDSEDSVRRFWNLVSALFPRNLDRGSRGETH